MYVNISVVPSLKNVRSRIFRQLDGHSRKFSRNKVYVSTYIIIQEEKFRELSACESTYKYACGTQFLLFENNYRHRKKWIWRSKILNVRKTCDDLSCYGCYHFRSQKCIMGDRLFQEDKRKLCNAVAEIVTICYGQS